jgi:hypothetical protein
MPKCATSARSPGKPKPCPGAIEDEPAPVQLALPCARRDDGKGGEHAYNRSEETCTSIHLEHLPWTPGHAKEDPMRRRLTVLLFASLGVLGALAPSASGFADNANASCVGFAVSSAAPGGTIGPEFSVAAQSGGQAFGETVSIRAHQHGNCHSQFSDPESAPSHGGPIRT